MVATFAFGGGSEKNNMTKPFSTCTERRIAPIIRHGSAAGADHLLYSPPVDPGVSVGF